MGAVLPVMLLFAATFVLVILFCLISQQRSIPTHFILQSRDLPNVNKPQHEKFYLRTCALSEDSDGLRSTCESAQSGHSESTDRSLASLAITGYTCWSVASLSVRVEHRIHCRIKSRLKRSGVQCTLRDVLHFMKSLTSQYDCTCKRDMRNGALFRSEQRIPRESCLSA